MTGKQDLNLKFNISPAKQKQVPNAVRTRENI